uniref:N-acetyltransferase n=1 Tax=Gongylonema pulchrum TaxID=637853 RepID=A0A183DJU7_9BILA
LVLSIELRHAADWSGNVLNCLMQTWSRFIPGLGYLVHWPRLSGYSPVLLKQFGFGDALKVCDPFQFQNLPNGVVSLFHYATRNEKKELVDKGAPRFL